MPAAIQRPHPRYLVITWSGADRETADHDDLSDAHAVVDAFAETVASAPFVRMDTHASIWDRVENRTVEIWRPARPKIKLCTGAAEIFASLIARGEPVSVISDRGGVHFNETVGRERVA